TTTSDRSIAPSRPLGEVARDFLLRRALASQRPKARLPLVAGRTLARPTSLHLLSGGRRDVWPEYHRPTNAAQVNRVRMYSPLQRSLLARGRRGIVRPRRGCPMPVCPACRYVIAKQLD